MNSMGYGLFVKKYFRPVKKLTEGSAIFRNDAHKKYIENNINIGYLLAGRLTYGF